MVVELSVQIDTVGPENACKNKGLPKGQSTASRAISKCLSRNDFRDTSAPNYTESTTTPCWPTWNTAQMQAVLDRWSNRRQIVPPELHGRIAPTRLEGINLRGVFRLPSASWLNMVERFFRDISENRIKRDSFASVADLEQAINDYIEHHNHHPKPFIWTATAADILAKVTHTRQSCFGQTCS